MAESYSIGCIHELCGPDGGRVLQAQFLDGLLTHEVLLDFARDGHRETVHEDDVARDFVVSDLAFAEVLYFCSGGLYAGFEFDPGDDLFAIFGIGNANDLKVADLGMGVEEFLNFAWVDVFATADDHVFDASNDVDVAFGVHGCQVSSMHPVGAVNCGCGGFGVVPIANHDAITTGAEFAGRSGGNDLSGSGIDDFDLKMRGDQTVGADTFVERGVDTGLRGDGAGLGHTVTDFDFTHVH